MFKSATTTLLLFLLLFPAMLCAQYSAVTHFGPGSGYPGNYAFRLFQDKQGYMWIGSENGLARFNGYQFKVFTTKDGLPDNEILFFAEDNQGRMFFAPFSNNIGYIKDGQVHNNITDSLLKCLPMRSKAEAILADNEGNIIVAEKNRAISISRKEELQVVYFGEPPFRYFSMFKTPAGDINMVDYNHILSVYKKDAWQPLLQLRLDLNIYYATSVIELLGQQKALAFFNRISPQQTPIFFDAYELDKFNSMCYAGKGLLGLARTDGFFLFDPATAAVVDTLLPGIPVAFGMVASDSSLWLCTHGDGLYRFTNTPVRSLPLKGKPRVTFLKGAGDTMYAATEKGGFVKARVVDSGVQVTEYRIPGYKRPDQIFRHLTRNKQQEWIGFSDRISVFDALDRQPKYTFLSNAFKDIVAETGPYLLAASVDGLRRFNKDLKLYTDVLYTGRLTAVAKLDGTIYAGTLEGLLSDGGGKCTFHKVLAAVPALQTRITKLYAGNNHTLWVATSQAELFAVKNDSIIATLNYQSGLQCSRIGAICVSEQFVLVGTDKGLYILDNKPPYAIIRHLNDAMGLNSNLVNCLDITGDIIWIGTAAGIDYCRTEDLFQHFTDARLVINSIINDRVVIPESDNTMHLVARSLNIDFDVIDHAGGQPPTLQYRLNDDDAWTTLENSELYFPEVPPGNFTVHIRAESPNWKTKLERSLLFYSPYPYYLRLWFILLCLALVAVITTLIVRRFIRRVRRKDEEKAAFQRRLLQLEQMALQGQLNPHFIFNSIAAIKQFYNSGDTKKANIFVDQFSALIRQTFEMGTQILVSLDKELHYLKQYLSIEQTRFSNTFDFDVTTDIELPASAIYVPVMLLQPLVENAVRHGIRHLSDRRGLVTIAVQQQGDLVTIVVTDNGVGRAQSKAFRVSFPGMDQVTSTTVNAKRVALLNELFNQQIYYKTIDVLDSNGQVAGTRITISYPLSIHQIYPK